MRCEEVVSELAAPTPDRDRAAMADHLAGCSACAEWARRADRLDQLWEATRPPEPSPQAWDSVWANIAGALPCPATAHREDAAASGARPSLNGSGARVLIPDAPQLAPVPSPSGAGARRRPRPWRVAAVALVGLAQAAAILVALSLALQAPPHPDAPPTDRIVNTGQPEPAAPAPIRVAKAVTVKEEFDPGCLMVIRMEEGKAPRLINATPPEMNTGSDPGLALFNFMEGSATPQVAAR